MDNSVVAQLLRDAVEAGVTRFAVGAYIADEGGRVLLLRRAPDTFLGGLFELPSGGVEKGETLPGALMREVAEETGLQVVAIETHINAFDYEEEFGIRTRQFNFAVKVQELVAVRLSSEHDAAEWFAANQTSDPRLDDQMRDLLTDYLSKVRTGNAR